MWIVLFGYAVICFMGFQMYTENKKRMNALAEYKERSGARLKTIEFGKAAALGMIIPMILCLFMAVYIYLVPESVDNEFVLGYVGISILLSGLFMLNYIMIKDSLKVFYNKDSFYLNGEIIRFTSVKSFKKRPMGAYDLELYTSKTSIKVPKIAAKAVQQLLDEIKNNKSKNK